MAPVLDLLVVVTGEAGGKISLILAPKMLKTSDPPHVWDELPGQGTLQSVWFLVQLLPTKVPHQHSVPALTPEYIKSSLKQADSQLSTVRLLPPAFVVRLLSVPLST